MGRWQQEGMKGGKFNDMNFKRGKIFERESRRNWKINGETLDILAGGFAEWKQESNLKYLQLKWNGYCRYRSLAWAGVLGAFCEPGH